MALKKKWQLWPYFLSIAFKFKIIVKYTCGNKFQSHILRNVKCIIVLTRKCASKKSKVLEVLDKCQINQDLVMVGLAKKLPCT